MIEKLLEDLAAAVKANTKATEENTRELINNFAQRAQLAEKLPSATATAPKARTSKTAEAKVVSEPEAAKTVEPEAPKVEEAAPSNEAPKSDDLPTRAEALIAAQAYTGDVNADPDGYSERKAKVKAVITWVGANVIREIGDDMFPQFWAKFCELRDTCSVNLMADDQDDM